MTPTAIAAIIVAFCAIVAVMAGLYGIWVGRSTHVTVQLGVTRRLALPAVIVVNESSFEITIVEVGMLDSNGSKRPLPPNSEQQTRLPAWISARSSAEFSYDLREAIPPSVRKLDVVYAKTATGRVVYNVPWWRRLASKARR